MKEKKQPMYNLKFDKVSSPNYHVKCYMPTQRTALVGQLNGRKRS